MVTPESRPQAAGASCFKPAIRRTAPTVLAGSMVRVASLVQGVAIKTCLRMRASASGALGFGGVCSYSLIHEGIEKKGGHRGTTTGP